MKITLLYPGIVRIGFNSLGRGGMDCNWINLGLAYLGAYLKKHRYDVDLMDLRDFSGWESVSDEMRRRDFDVLGVYFNTPNYDNALQSCKIAKQLNKIVVAGGPHASVDPESLLSTKYVDHVIIGEGEASFLETVRRLENNSPVDKIIVGKFAENLDDLPFPERDLYNLAKVNTPRRNFPYLNNGHIIMTSRGCPFNCSFCQPLAQRMFGKRVRYRSVRNVINEIKYLVDKYKAKYISFQDDTFTARKEWVKEFCKELNSLHLGIQWSAQSRVDTFDDELASAMRAAGCVCIFFGFESGSDNILKFIKKGITAEQSLAAARLCKKHKILILADYMIGIPTETDADIEQTLELAKKIRAEMISVTYFTPIPGSELFEYCKNNGLIKIDKYENFSRNPTGEKIRGINYQKLDKYRHAILATSPCWWAEKHFARLALKRWLFLANSGYFGDMSREIIRYSLPMALVDQLDSFKNKLVNRKV